MFSFRVPAWSRAAAALMTLVLISACAPAGAEVHQATAAGPIARSAILFIGDGMGLAQVEAARAWSGKPLAMERLPEAGLSRTRSTNSAVTDSAAAATALACGVHTDNGTIGLTDAKTDPSGRSRALQNITQVALAAGKSVGVITTAHVAHATPAGFYAHVATRADGVGIADQVVTSGLTLLLGGGRIFFYPQGWKDPETGGDSERKDTRALADELAGQGWSVVQSLAEFRALDPAKEGLRVLGLFEPSHLQYDLDRSKDKLGEPSLTELTAFAIDVLRRDPDGYFLMVEGGKIDHAGHGNNIQYNIGETLEFDSAIGRARALEGDAALIVVTADHETGGLTLPGEIKAGEIPVEAVKWSTGGHTGADVGIFAGGPGAERFGGVMDNCEIAWHLAGAMGLSFTDPVNLENAAPRSR